MPSLAFHVISDQPFFSSTAFDRSLPFLTIIGARHQSSPDTILTMQRQRCRRHPDTDSFHLSPKPFVVFLLVRLGSVPYHLPQLVFLDEFAVQDAKVVDQIFATLHQSGARGDGTISLNAEFELTDKERYQRKTSGFGMSLRGNQLT